MNNNQYYHDVALSFNWWSVFAVASLIVFAIIGWHQYELVRIKGKYRIKKAIEEDVIMLLALLDSIVFGIMLAAESWRGILQFLDNHSAPGEAPVLSVIILPLAIVLIVAMYLAIIYYVAVTSGVMRYNQLGDQRRKKNRIAARKRNDPWV